MDEDNLTPEQLAARLETLEKKFEQSANLEKSGNQIPIEVASKQVGENNQQAMTLMQKGFDVLSKTNRKFAKFSSNEAMDNPFDYLHRKKLDPATGREDYVISNRELEEIIQTLMVAPKGNDTTDLMMSGWMTTQKSAIESKFEEALRAGGFGQNAQTISKALDTTSGGPLIRVDLEPFLYEAYLRSFPMDDKISRIPANGLQHTFNQITDPGSAATISELGSMSGLFSNVTPVRKTSTNIAIIVSPRAISLKLQYATAQSGMPFNLGMSDGNLELVGAMRAMAKKNQTLFFQGNNETANNAGTLNDEVGLYGANDFTGIRNQLATFGLTKGGGQTIYDAVDQAVAQVINAGGDEQSVLIPLSVGARRAMNAELQSQYRIVSNGGVTPYPTNLTSAGLVTVSDWVAKMLNIPSGAQADGIGYYTISATQLEDIYVLDPNGHQFAYLGSPTPTILELPVGFNNVLSQVYYPFMMNGLVLRIPSFNRKVRIPKQTV